MSVQPQPSTPQVSPPVVEVSWDDALDGKFPPTRQQRLQQAVTQAAEQVFTQPAVQANPERLHKAMDLVLAGAVTLHPDGTATVKSGSRSYTINGECTCADAQHRTTFCKHHLAVLIHRRATALLQGTAHAPAPSGGPDPGPEPAAPSQPEAPASPVPPNTPRASAAWDVHEAPTSACFKFRVHTMELTYTFRGVDDAELTTRISATLPLLQEIIDACEDRYAARLAEREAAKAAPTAPAHAPQVQPPSPPETLQQLIQQALVAQGNSQAPSSAPATGATGQPPAPPAQAQPADTPEGYCAIHQVQMYLNSNERGSWYSHLATDYEGQEYFCKGRPRRNGR